MPNIQNVIRKHKMEIRCPRCNSNHFNNEKNRLHGNASPFSVVRLINWIIRSVNIECLKCHHVYKPEEGTGIKFLHHTASDLEKTVAGIYQSKGILQARRAYKYATGVRWADSISDVNEILVRFGLKSKDRSINLAGLAYVLLMILILALLVLIALANQ